MPLGWRPRAETPGSQSAQNRPIHVGSNALASCGSQTHVYNDRFLGRRVRVSWTLNPVLWRISVYRTTLHVVLDRKRVLGRKVLLDDANAVDGEAGRGRRIG